MYMRQSDAGNADEDIRFLKRTDEVGGRWKSTGYALSDEERRFLQRLKVLLVPEAISV